MEGEGILMTSQSMDGQPKSKAKEGSEGVYCAG